MTRFSFLRPLDQPIGRRRLLQDMMAALQNDSFAHFWFIVAYAKSGPLYRLQGLLEKWRSSGKTSAAIIGLDQRGTSKEALELLLTLFDSVYVTQDSRITFHPKIYLFRGADQAEAFIGSNNLTVGGTEKNFEAGVHLRFDLPKDADDLVMLESAWSELLPTACDATVRLDPNILARLVADNVVVEEKAMHIYAGDRAHVGGGKKNWTSCQAREPATQEHIPNDPTHKSQKGEQKSRHHDTNRSGVCSSTGSFAVCARAGVCYTDQASP